MSGLSFFFSIIFIVSFEEDRSPSLYLSFRSLSRSSLCFFLSFFFSLLEESVTLLPLSFILSFSLYLSLSLSTVIFFNSFSFNFGEDGLFAGGREGLEGLFNEIDVGERGLLLEGLE